MRLSNRALGDPVLSSLTGAPVSNNMKRALTILAVVIVLGGAGYFYFFGGSAGVTVAPPGETTLPSAGDAVVTDTSEPVVDTATPSAPTPVSARLVKISSGPVARGAVVTNKAPDASSSPIALVSYIERQSGNVFSYNTSTGGLTRTSNRTLPGIQSAEWLPDGSRAFVRYLSGADSSTINTYALPADGGDGFFLAQNLSDLAVSASGVVTLTSGVNGSVGSLLRSDGTRVSGIFTSPLSSLRLSFAGKNQYLAFTKPAAALPGIAFLVSGSGAFSRIAGPHNGLVAKASPSGKWVLISYARDGNLQMELRNVATGEVVPLPVATIADKCVWSADDSVIYCGIPVEPPLAAYPDDWYQGALSFSDRIWRIQVDGRYAQFVLDFMKETDEPLDAEALAVDPLLTTLMFVNKRDGSLWSYQL